MSNYSTEQLRELASRVLIDNPKYMDMGGEANGLAFFIDVCCELPGLDGAKWRQLRHWIALNAPGLLDRTPSPDNILRRGREVKELVRQKGLQQPPLTKTL